MYNEKRLKKSRLFRAISFLSLIVGLPERVTPLRFVIPQAVCEPSALILRARSNFVIKEQKRPYHKGTVVFVVKGR